MNCLNRRCFAGFLLASLVAMMFLPPAYARTMTLNVAAGEEKSEPLNLSVDDHVVMKVSVIGLGGGSENVLDFSLCNPDGTVKKSFVGTGSVDYSFICEVDGTYAMNFSNVAYPHDKQVTLNYEIEHYIFGMPQMFFLTIVIAILCVAAVAVFIFMGKPH